MQLSVVEVQSRAHMLDILPSLVSDRTSLVEQSASSSPTIIAGLAASDTHRRELRSPDSACSAGLMRSCVNLTLASLLAVACGSPPSRSGIQSPPGPRAQGIVQFEDGRPADNVVLRISDPLSGNRLETSVTGKDGVYELSVPAGKYIVTGAANTGWLRVDDAFVGERAPDLVVSQTCERVSGSVTPAADGSSVAFTRLSEKSGDTFVIYPKRGEFNACLPTATYAVAAAGTLRSQKVLFEAGTSPKLHVVAHHRTDVESPYSGPAIPHRDLSEFAAAAGKGSSIVGLGESNHGTREFLDLRLKLSLELALTHDFNTILLEAGFGEVLALDAYVHGAELDVAKAVQLLGYWMWDTEEFHDVLKTLRAHNERSPPADRISLMGIDVQDTEAIVALLLGDARLSLSDDERQAIQSLAASRGRSAAQLSASELDRLRAVLLDVQNGVRTTATPTSRLAARALRHRVIAVTAGLADSVRARHFGMADMVTAILGSAPGTRATIWAHNAHVAREPSFGIPMMGQHLDEALGSRYFPIALMAGEGEARAWDARGEVGVVLHRLSKPPRHYVESALTAPGTDGPVFVVLDQSNAVSTWLRTPRYLLEFGAAFDEEPTLRDMSQAFRAIAFLPKVNPTTPTPTGERRAQPRP